MSLKLLWRNIPFISRIEAVQVARLVTENLKLFAIVNTLHVVAAYL